MFILRSVAAVAVMIFSVFAASDAEAGSRGHGRHGGGHGYGGGYSGHARAVTYVQPMRIAAVQVVRSHSYASHSYARPVHYAAPVHHVRQHHVRHHQPTYVHVARACNPRPHCVC